MVSAAIDPEMKRKAEEILARLGLRHSEAIRIFYHMVIEHKGLPFRVHLADGGKIPEMDSPGNLQDLSPEILSHLRKSIRLNRRLAQGL